MNTIKDFLIAARQDKPVYITDVRDSFQAGGTRPFHLHVTDYDGGLRVFPLLLPETENEQEADFAASYIYAMIYNLLSSAGARTITVYTDSADAGLMALAQGLEAVFQNDLQKRERTGYGKSLNVNERILAALSGRHEKLRFEVRDCRQEPEAEAKAEAVPAAPVFDELPARTKGRMLLGIDVGGTDIKLLAGCDGHLALCKEYDWFPGGFQTGDELVEPVLLLTRLLRAATCLKAQGREEEIVSAALLKDALRQEMEAAAAEMEAALGDSLSDFDGIGLSFPDVVIRNMIVGGETAKTKGMRENPDADYEAEFKKVSALGERLKAFVKEDGAVMITNDGPMAAFTAAVEMAAAGADVSKGFFAHTLGTELGTGWVKGDGSIPEIPLEVYNFIIDLGSFVQKGYDSADVRSTNNINTALAGTAQKYTSQFGVFRLAAKYLPEADPELYQALFDRGLFAKAGEQIVVPTAPKDMRKACLEFLMECADGGEHPVCGDIFREIGAYLAVIWQETEYILCPEAKDRSLFGRLVKRQACFDRMLEGARERVPDLEMYAADSSMAYTGLMKELDEDPEYTVAQFAQAAGAVFFACTGLR